MNHKIYSIQKQKQTTKKNNKRKTTTATKGHEDITVYIII